jgi:sec-independent protein translocase protein TatA
MLPTLAFLPHFSGWELLIILAVGLLIFGSRLPSVGKNLGKSIVEFKKGIKGVEEEINKAEQPAAASSPRAITEGTPTYRAPLGPAGEERRVAQGQNVATPDAQ